MPTRVYLHVGAPKTGTTYLQSRLFTNRKSLRSHGVLYPVGPLKDPRFHYFAALDVTGVDHAVPHRHLDGAFGRLCRQVRRARGEVVISHELFSRATRAQATHALEQLSATGAEVHIVVSARDLSRQLTSGWQEDLKFGSTITFAEFLAQARQDQQPFAQMFDPVRSFHIWGSGLPSTRLHLVTAPPAGSGGELLWLRFLDAVGIDPSWTPRAAQENNSSVGVPEAQLLRQLNDRIGPAVQRGGPFVGMVNGPVLAKALAPRRSERIGVGPDDYPWLSARCREWVDWLSERGVLVHGALDDLLPEPPAHDWIDPDAVGADQVADASLDVIETLLAEEAGRRRSLAEYARAAVRRLRA